MQRSGRRCQCCYLATKHLALEVLLQTFDVMLPFSGGQESTYFNIKSDMSNEGIDGQAPNAQPTN